MSKREWMPPATPSEIDWARLAAFIDGEGCIGIRKRTWQKPDRVGKSSPAYVVTVVICNTDPRLITWLKDTFQIGTVFCRDFKNPGESSKYNHPRPCYVWESQARAGQWLLEGCLPFFVMKKDQAQICLEMRATYSDHRGGSKHHLSLAVLSSREELKQKLHNEKQRTITMEEINHGMA